MENKNLNMRKEMNSKTVEELRKEEVEREMKKIRERMQQRQRGANTEETLKRQEEEQKAKIEALRQKLQRERQAQIIREMADRNAARQKATIIASQIAAREEKKARETGRTSDFDAEQKKREMMDAFNIQRSKSNAKNLIPDEVNLKLAEDELEETKAAQDRRKQVEETMEELRAEQIKRLEEEKKQKTSAIKNIFNKLTSWPRRKIPTQEELSNDGLREGTTTVNSVENNKDIQEERVEQNLEMSKDIPYMNKEKVIQTQELSEEMSYQDKELLKLYDAAVELGSMTREEADKSFKKGQELERIKKQAEEARKEAEIAKAKEEQRKLHKMSYAAQQYFSKLFNPGQKLSRKDNTKTKNNLIKNLRCQVDEELAFQNYLQKAQDNKDKENTKYVGPEYV